MTIEEAPKIIYDKTLVRCIIWVSRASLDLKICDPNKFAQESKEYVAQINRQIKRHNKTFADIY